MKNKFPLLNKKEQTTLYDALHYTKMAALKKACVSFSLSDKGKKGELIKRIMLFIQTGTIQKPLKIPAKSRAKNYPPQALKPTALMLHGSYKNDEKTRALFKKLVGPQFHFTAFGVDWLNNRWLQGDPPTYQEFARYWVEEKERRKKTKAKPKDEWMYIRFMQQMSQSKPNTSKEDLTKAWKLLQTEKSKKTHQLLKKAIAKLSSN